MKAAIYCRYSSEKQSIASLDDQERNCRLRADREGWTLTAVYQDAAISGSRNDRPGYRALLDAAEDGAVAVILVDDLSRLSRDSVEQERVIRRLEFDGVRVVGVSDGYDSHQHGRKLTRGMRGLINEVYLDDLRDKTRRGLTGKALKGAAAGGRVYGYTTVQDGDDRRYQVDPAQAAVVRRIFTEFSEGLSTRTIAAQLNQEGIPSPRTTTWSFSAMYGHPQKKTGILRNRMYIGTLIWNRSLWVKDPETGIRKRRDRPRDEWIVHQDEALRIVDQELWEKVQERLNAIQERTRAARTARNRGGKGARPYTRNAYLLSGLVQCSACGGPVNVIGRDMMGCGVHKDRGDTVCANRMKVKRQHLEQRVIDGLIRHLDRDEYRQTLVAEVRSELRRLERGDERARVEQQLAAVQAKISRTVMAITNMAYSEALTQALAALEEEQAGLQAHLSRLDRQVPVLVSDEQIAGMVAAQIQRLLELPRMDVERARSALGEMIAGKIKLLPANENAPAVAEAHVAFYGSGGRI